MIAVELGEILRDLPLAERVVERVVDQLRLDAEARCLVAVDRQGQRGAARSADRSRRRAARAASSSSRGSSAPTGSARRDWRPAGCIDTACASRGRRHRCPAPPAGTVARLRPWRAAGAAARMTWSAVDVALVARLQRDVDAAVVLRLRAAGADRSCRRWRRRDPASTMSAERFAGGASSRRTKCPAPPPRCRVMSPVSCCGKKPFGMTTNR